MLSVTQKHLSGLERGQGSVLDLLLLGSLVITHT